MTQFRVTINADKWPYETTVEASSFSTAISRAVKSWKKKDGKGSRTTTLNVRIIKFVDKPTTNE